MSIKILEPALERKKEPLIKLAPRLDTLKGKTITLWNELKPASFPMLEVIEKHLVDQGVKDFIRIFDNGYSYNDTRPTPEEWVGQKSVADALKGDAVVLALGD